MQATLFRSDEGARARRSDSQTSWDAARSISQETLSRTRQAILELLRKRELTNQQLEEALCSKLGVEPQRIRSDRSWLTKQGLVVQVNKVGKTLKQRSANVWRAV